MGIDQKSIEQLTCNYMSLGINGLITANQNCFLAQSVEGSGCFRLLSGLRSLIDICQKYGIRSKGQLWHWILTYDGLSLNIPKLAELNQILARSLLARSEIIYLSIYLNMFISLDPGYIYWNRMLVFIIIYFYK